MAKKIEATEPKNYNFCLCNNGITNRNGLNINVNGIDCNNFLKNPIGFYNHNENSPIGTWSNLSIEDGKMCADFNFDEDDEEAIKVKGKVDKGILKGASVGIKLTEYSFDDLTDSIIANKCELLEASIVSIPADANAMKMYIDDELITEDSLNYLKNSLKNKQIGLKIAQEAIEESKGNKIGVMVDSEIDINTTAAVIETIPEIPVEAIKIENNLVEMKQEKIETILENKMEDTFFSKLVKTIHIELTDDKVKNENLALLKILEYKNKIDEIETNKINNFIDSSITKGKILPGQKDKYIKLAQIDFEMVKSLVESMPNQVKLNDVINNNIKDEYRERETWSFMEWVEKDYDGLQKMKVADVERYNKLYSTTKTKIKK